MPGLHENERSSSSEGEKCQCPHVHDPLNCSAKVDMKPKWKYRITLDRSRDNITSENQLDLVKSEESQQSLNLSLPQMKYSNSTKNIQR